MNEEAMLEMIRANGRLLTKRQLWVLDKLANGTEDEQELVYERGRGYVDLEPIAGRTVLALVRACAISLDSSSQVGVFERYTINSTGRQLLESRKNKRASSRRR